MRKFEDYLYERQLRDIYRNNKGIYTEKEAEEVFIQALKDKGLYDEFIESFKSSDQVLLRELAKTYLLNLSEISDYKLSNLWLQTTKDVENAYDIVRFYDYSIVRSKAPVVKLRYIGSDTLHLVRGQSIGKYKGYDIVNTKDTMYLEYGDVKTFKLGRFVEDTITAQYDSEVKKLLKPKYLKSIDNDEVRVFKEGKSSSENITKHIVPYIKGEAVRDFSLDNKATEIVIMDKKYEYGVYDNVTSGSTFKINYLECDGVLEDIDKFTIEQVKFNDLIKDKVEYIVIDYVGYDGDTIDTLKTYAPLVSSTKGMANSLKQYRTLLSALPELYDANPFKEEGRGKSYTIKIEHLGDFPKKFGIDFLEYTFTGDTSDLPMDAIRNDFKDLYEFEVLSEDTFKVYTTNKKALNKFVPITYLTKTGEEDGVDNQCCILMTPYVREALVNRNETNNTLTDGEKISVANEIEKFKSWNTEIRLYPAKERVINIEVDVMLSEGIKPDDNLDKEIDKIFKSYSYKIGMKIPVPEILNRLANIRVLAWGKGDRAVVTMVSTKPELVNKVFVLGRDIYAKINYKVNFVKW